MTQEEIQKVETLVNEKIRENLPVRTDIMSLEDAKKTGAMALSAKNTGMRSGWYPWEISPGNSAEEPT